MSEGMILAIIAIALAVPPFIRQLFLAAICAWQFLSRQLVHPDLAVRVLRQQEKVPKPKAHIKVAYAGSTPLIWEAIKITANLKIPTRLERVAAWVQIAVGYLTYDIEGLETVLGHRYSFNHYPLIHTWRGPRLLNRALSFLNGLWMCYFLLLMFITPIVGWMFLLSGPYGRFELVADDSSIEIKDVVGGTTLKEPFLLKPGVEEELFIGYEWTLKAPGFWPNTRIDYVTECPKRSFWRLPHKDEFVWQASEIIHIRMRNRWQTYPVSLGTGLVKLD